MQSQFRIQAPVWKTCLRQIVFVHPEQWELFRELNDLRGDEVMKNGAALQFLMEVLCGLHSPVFGETEVLGQFKTYMNDLPSNHVLHRVPGLSAMILRTVKEVRTKYLQEAGSFSYGQLLRRKIRGEESVTLWGFGQLGQEIHRWIKESKVHIVARDVEKVRDKLRELAALKSNFPADAQVLSLNEVSLSSLPRTHIVAAPLSDSLVSDMVAASQDSQIFDLRDETGLEHERITPLRDLMSESENLKRDQRKILPACQQLIGERVQEYLDLAIHRPYCWEDLCG